MAIHEVKGVFLPKTDLGMKKMQKLCVEAEKLFAAKGFYETSISEICNAAHTAVGTFYIYFDSKTAIYRYLVENYRHEIKRLMATSIVNCTTRLEKEREGIKAFVLYAKQRPYIYDIIWGSLSVEKQLFENYYISFAKSYYNSILRDIAEIDVPDIMTLAYSLMGVTNFISLRAILENMDEKQVEEMVDKHLMPLLERGIYKAG